MPEIDDHVAFADAAGSIEIAIVTHVWPRHTRDDRPPLINVKDRRTGIVYTSVPHRHDVVGADGFYYT